MPLDLAEDDLRGRGDLPKLVEDPVLETDVERHGDDGDEDANRHLKLVEIETVVGDDAPLRGLASRRRSGNRRPCRRRA